MTTKFEPNGDGTTVYNYDIENNKLVIVPDTNYGTLVSAVITLEYNKDEQLALLRQKDSKPKEFNEFFNRCEEIKAMVKADLTEKQD